MPDDRVRRGRLGTAPAAPTYPGGRPERSLSRAQAETVISARAAARLIRLFSAWLTVTWTDSRRARSRGSFGRPRPRRFMHGF